MDSKIGFRWIELVIEKVRDNPTILNSKLNLTYRGSNLNLAQLVKKAKPKWFKQRQVVLKNGLHSIGINGLTNPIQLVEDFETTEYGNLYKLSDKGPSVQWLLDNKKRINNPDPNKVLYVDDMAIRIVSAYCHNDNVVVEMVRVKDIEAFINRIGNNYTQWLGNTFKQFLIGYAYTDTRIHRDLSITLTVFQVSKKLGFKNPEKVAARLVSNRLVADLVLKGVFESMEKDVFPPIYNHSYRKVYV